jgi:hypothetical protein
MRENASIAAATSSSFSRVRPTSATWAAVAGKRARDRASDRASAAIDHSGLAFEQHLRLLR